MDTEMNYYIAPDGTTAYTSPGQPVPTLNGAPMARASKAEYDTKEAANAAARLADVPRQKLAEVAGVLVSRSPGRVAPAALDGNYLDEGRQYAVFVPDGPWTSVQFTVDGQESGTQTAAPWDAFGTAEDGTSVRRTFPAGNHTVEAIVTAGDATRTLTATFEVE